MFSLVDFLATAKATPIVVFYLHFDVKNLLTI